MSAIQVCKATIEKGAQEGTPLIRKPTSVRMAGYLSLALCVVFTALWIADYYTSSGRELARPGGVAALGILASTLYWSVGTVIHRSRLNRMRYREQADVERKT